MAKTAKDLLDAAKALGYQYKGQDGHEHHVVVHPDTGAIRRIGCTPSEYRGYANTLAELRRGAPKEAVEALRQKRNSDVDYSTKKRARAERERRDAELVQAAYQARVDELSRKRLERRTGKGLHPRDLGRLDEWTIAKSVATRMLDMGVTPTEVRAALVAPFIRREHPERETRAFYYDKRIKLVVDERDKVCVGIFWRSEHDAELEQRRHARLARRIEDAQQRKEQENAARPSG